MKTDNKTIEYIQTTLRSASDIYKRGGHVTMQYRDQLFRMHFDLRRVLNWETTIPSTIEVLIDSKPLLDLEQGHNLRVIGRLAKNKLFGKFTSAGRRKRKYKNAKEVVVRNFIKGLVSTPPLFNLKRSELFTNKCIIDYINAYDPTIKISENSISQLKRYVSSVKWVPLQKTKESVEFINYVKITFKDFDEDSYYKMM